MFFKQALREKNTPLVLRILWRIINSFSGDKIFIILLNTVWALWRLSWEQTNIYEARQKTTGKIDILRPRNVSDAIKGMSQGDLVCDFGGGAGDITAALLSAGCQVVYCDTNSILESEMLERFGENPLFSVADSVAVIEGKVGEFDLVVMSHVLEHIENPRIFLETLGKTTKRIHIEVPDLASDPLNYIRIKLGLRVYKDDDHVIEMSLEYLEDLVKKSNYSIETLIARDACLVLRAKSNL